MMKEFFCPRPPAEPTDPVELAKHREKLRVIALMCLLDFCIDEPPTASTVRTMVSMIGSGWHRRPFVVALADAIQRWSQDDVDHDAADASVSEASNAADMTLRELLLKARFVAKAVGVEPST